LSAIELPCESGCRFELFTVVLERKILNDVSDILSWKTHVKMFISWPQSILGAYAFMKIASELHYNRKLPCNFQLFWISGSSEVDF
jgi:hypothetical protein